MDMENMLLVSLPTTIRQSAVMEHETDLTRMSDPLMGVAVEVALNYHSTNRDTTHGQRTEWVDPKLVRKMNKVLDYHMHLTH